MGTILSHTTALNAHRAAGAQLRIALRAHGAAAYVPCAPDADGREFAKAVLRSRELIDPNAEELDVLVAHERHRHAGALCHIWKRPIPAGNLIPIAPGVAVTSLPLTLLQLAGSLTCPELVELIYEACGTYMMPEWSHDTSRTLAQHDPHTTIAEIEQCLYDNKGAYGANRLRRALSFARDGARSPMETALAMLLALPRQFGGLGIRDVEMDERIDINGRARQLTRRSHLVCDIYLPRFRLDIEYNGAYHDDDEQQAIDEERRRALEAMGYRLMVFTRHSILNKAGFDRAIRALMREIGRRPSRNGPDFFESQEQLRQFVLRKHLPASGA